MMMPEHMKAGLLLSPQSVAVFLYRSAMSLAVCWEGA
jgi:hypothetical protein